MMMRMAMGRHGLPRLLAVLLAGMLLAGLLMGLLSGCGQKAKVEDLLSLGASYFSDGRYDEAIAVYEEVLAIDAKNVAAYERLAAIYLAREDWGKAVRVLDAGVAAAGEEPALTALRDEAVAGQKAAEEQRALAAPLEEAGEAARAATEGEVPEWPEALEEAWEQVFETGETRYAGETDENGLPSGQGQGLVRFDAAQQLGQAGIDEVFVYFYVGQWANGLPHGQGTAFFGNQCFVGTWQNGIPDGQGILWRNGGMYLSGGFKNGFAQGEMTYMFSEGLLAIHCNLGISRPVANSPFKNSSSLCAESYALAVSNSVYYLSCPHTYYTWFGTIVLCGK